MSMPEQPKAEAPSNLSLRALLAAFLLAAAAPLALCAGKLNNELWTDEVYTLTMFASVPLDAAAGDYSAPNNHILYSQGLHLWLSTIGSLRKAEFMLRLPNLALAATALGGAFALGLRCRGLAAAVAGAVMLGLTQMFLGHAMQLRGYGLSMALAAWLAVLALPGQRGGALRWPAIALLGAAALYTVPTNLLWLAPLAMCAVATSALAHRGWRPATVEALAWLAAGLLAAALYLPVYHDVLAAGGGPVEDRWATVGRLATSFVDIALRDAWPLVILAACGGGVWLRTWRTSSGRQGLALIAGTVCGTFIAAGALGTIPFVRNFCPLLPIVSVGVGYLVSEFTSSLLGVVQRRRGAAYPETIHAAVAGMVIAGVLLPAVLTHSRRLETQRRQTFAQDGYFNYYDADFHPARLVKALRDTAPAEEGYLLMIPDEDNFTVSYYLAQYAVPQRKTPPAGGPPAIRLYAALAPQTDVQLLLGQWQLPAGLAAEMSTVADVGYFRLVRWPKLWPLANWRPAAENRPLAPSAVASPSTTSP